jgi:hypothetical protein
MKPFKSVLFYLFLSVLSFQIKAQDSSRAIQNDSLTLAQSYMNLSLTESYFDSLGVKRLSKTIPFEESELSSIKDTNFITQNATLYNFTYSLLYLNKAKALYRNRNEISREVLIRWKDTLERAIRHFNQSNIDSDYTVEKEKNTFYELIKFDGTACYTLPMNIRALKREFNPYFNNDIYPDFKRIFNAAKRSGEYHFDSLSYYAEIYQLPLSMSILNNTVDGIRDSYGGNLFVSSDYDLDSRLDLISRYLQLKYLASGRDAKIPERLDLQLLYEAYYNFVQELEYEDDEFIKKELNAEAYNLLYQQLQSKFPYEYIPAEPEYLSASPSPFYDEKVQYFFPDPAPLPSASFTVEDFKPEIKLLGQVDSHLSRFLINAGYKGQLHYYYDLDGFALATSLEKFNRDGSRVEDGKRFTKNLGGDGKFSYFEIFKSLFFETESEFRMFAFVIASKKVSISNDALSPGAAEELIKNSYPSLPADLEDKTLPNKNLTVLVYHFHQNDIGEVPMLDLGGEITAEGHLQKAGLSELIKN